MEKSEDPPSAKSANPAKRLPAELALFGVALFWGINMPIMKYALGQMDEFLFNAVRLTMSAITLAACLIYSRYKSPSGNRKAIPRKYWLPVAAYIVLGGFAYQLLFLFGIKLTTAGNTALILSAIPVWTAVLAFIFLKERLSRLGWLGLFLAVSGVVIVTLGKPKTLETLEMSRNVLIGNVLISFAAFSWALLSVISRKVMKVVAPLDLAFYCVAFTLPLHYMLAIGIWPELGEIIQKPLLLAALIYSGVFSTGIAIAFWNFGVKTLGASHAAGFQNLVPLIALGASWILIGEVPFAMQIGGGVLIIIGMVAMRRQRRQAPQTLPDENRR